MHFIEQKKPLIYIVIPILLYFLQKVLSAVSLALVQVMAWHWKEDKPLSEPRMLKFYDVMSQSHIDLTLNVRGPS